MVQAITAIFFILHGAVHLLGFVVPWQIMQVEGMPYTTTILGGRVNVGNGGIRFVGLLWMLATITFVVAGIGLLLSAPWWWSVTMGATLFSLFLCILGWPEARWGALIDVLIVAVLIIGSQLGLTFLPFP